jgi:3-methyladenine DNA glycosylase AlkD
VYLSKRRVVFEQKLLSTDIYPIHEETELTGVEKGCIVCPYRPMNKKSDIMEELKSHSRPGQLDGMARYGIKIDNRYGVCIPVLRKIAKQTGKDHQLALRLWKTGISDAMILASLIDIPDRVTDEQMETWVKDFDSWDICDQVCMNLFDKTSHVRKKILAWAFRDEEFVKRAAFALIASLAVHDKKAPDDDFIAFFKVITIAATDNRNYVKKAVSWALRSIGKRNGNLNQAALAVSKELGQSLSKTARWIASDATRDLTSETTKKKLEQKKFRSV